MPFKKGQSGNPGGRGTKKPMTDALMMALKEESKKTGPDGKPTKKMREVAVALVDRAIEGDVAAIREINDRIDGKVTQKISGDEDGAPIRYQDDSFTPTELAHRIHAWLESRGDGSMDEAPANGAARVDADGNGSAEGRA